MRWSIIVTISVLYAVQFIPVIFAMIALPIVMREAGQSATNIGLVQLAGLPYVFKFLWAPLIDKYSIGRHHYKGWIYLLSTLHIASLLLLASLDPAGPIQPLVMVLLFAMATVSTQDIAVDALAVSLMTPGERTLGASAQNLGIYLGAVVGGFVFLSLYSAIGWAVALWVQAGLFALPLLGLLWLREPARVAGGAGVGVRAALGVFRQPRMGRWIATLATLRLPLVLVSLPVQLMMVDQGMSTEAIARWFGLFAMGAAGAACVVAGVLFGVASQRWAINVVARINLVLMFVVCLCAAFLPGDIRYALVALWAAIALADVVLYRGALARVRPEFPGFDFSVQIAVMSLLSILADPVVGVVFDRWGYMPVFIVSVLLAGLILLFLGGLGSASPKGEGEGGR